MDPKKNSERRKERHDACTVEYQQKRFSKIIHSQVPHVHELQPSRSHGLLRRETKMKVS